MREDLNLQNPKGTRFYGPLQLTISASHAQTGGSGASRTLTSRKMARFGRGGLATFPALPNKLAEIIRFERMTPIGCSALAVRRLRLLGQLSVKKTWCG